MNLTARKRVRFIRWKMYFGCALLKRGSGSIVRSSISAFRVEDPGSNPGRSTISLKSVCKRWRLGILSVFFGFVFVFEFVDFYGAARQRNIIFGV